MGSDKEILTWVKDAFSEGLDRSEIIRRLQGQGYKLEYIDSLISRASMGRRILINTLFFILGALIIGVIFISYIYFSPNKMENLENPVNKLENNLTFEALEVNPQIISYLMNSIGVWKLKSDPTTFNKPIINIDIDGQKFSSVVNNGKIQTSEGENSGADVKIFTKKKIILDSISTNNSIVIFKQSFISGESQVEMVASEKDLFLKGYLGLYDSLAKT
jgi:hypothetical protein